MCLRLWEVATDPPRATIGSPSLFAVASPVVRLLTPGPDVAIATPALPVNRPIPPAMKAAFCSCRQTTVSIEEDFKVSKTLSIFAPGMPNTCVTPCRSSDSTTICAPVLNVLGLISVLSKINLLSFLIPLGAHEVVTWITTEIGFEKFRGLRQGNMHFVHRTSADRYINRLAFQQVATPSSICGYEMEVVSGNAKRAGKPR